MKRGDSRTAPRVLETNSRCRGVDDGGGLKQGGGYSSDSLITPGLVNWRKRREHFARGGRWKFPVAVQHTAGPEKILDATHRIPTRLEVPLKWTAKKSLSNVLY